MRLKLRLLRNGSRRTRNTPWAKVGFYLSLVNSAVAAVAGFVLAVMLRGEFDAVERHRILVLGIAMVVFGWWFGPLISGGVDETIDPARLVLLPLTRSLGNKLSTLPETYAWTDAGEVQLVVVLEQGRVSKWSLLRPEDQA